ncbi:hypothetical protein HMPREF0083_04301 [Aneurinibacillus aneurinilyticus ATCC 12856]|uniref:Uncharacterized protein n=1 Tax=Aneurinibacillus aneurinilyticus ATCC 12856 TaxID=649747 RepID=U1Y644_ANEAE|nr:hypothetical protein HMPREF0083_04301 [Aneurinibacillus aneurinilyticus ATCC 12856]
MWPAPAEKGQRAFFQLNPPLPLFLSLYREDLFLNIKRRWG